MKRMILPAVVALAFCNVTVAQTSSVVPDNIRAAYSIDRFGDGIINEMIYGIPLPAPKVIGDTYIEEEWLKGRILVYGREKFIEGYAIRYDLEKQELEVQTGEGVKVIGGKQIKSFVTSDPDHVEPSLFVNAMEFRMAGGTRYDGFVRILQDGQFALVSGFEVRVKRPDYNEAMHVGSRDYKIYKKEVMFYVSDRLLSVLPEKKKGLLSIFPAHHRQQVADRIESENLNISRRNDLIALFRWYNAAFER